MSRRRLQCHFLCLGFWRRSNKWYNIGGLPELATFKTWLLFKDTLPASNVGNYEAQRISNPWKSWLWLCMQAKGMVWRHMIQQPCWAKQLWVWSVPGLPRNPVHAVLSPNENTWYEERKKATGRFHRCDYRVFPCQGTSWCLLASWALGIHNPKGLE